jgi:hypothetical protein
MEANMCNSRISISKQGTNKHASLTIEGVFSAWSRQRGYKEVFSTIKRSEESSFSMPACQDMSLGAEERIEPSLWNWQLQNNGKKEIRKY